jgi:hypothetical protein
MMRLIDKHSPLLFLMGNIFSTSLCMGLLSFSWSSNGLETKTMENTILKQFGTKGSPTHTLWEYVLDVQ